MQTDTYFAHEVEVGDHMVIGPAYAPITEKDDEGDFILLTIKDDDGDATQLPFGPFDPVEIVTSFEDEDISVEDIEVEITS